jgi:hypothetical protein
MHDNSTKGLNGTGLSPVLGLANTCGLVEVVEVGIVRDGVACGVERRQSKTCCLAKTLQRA